MSFDNVIYEKGEVATLTLNRPDISNGFNIPTCQEILEVLDLVKADDSVKILVIQAVGKIFFNLVGIWLRCNVQLNQIMSNR